MNDSSHSELVKAALDVRLRAYAPYSQFQVGAALETHDGIVFVGCNVENASYGLCICAERTAAVSAIAAGITRFRRLAVAATGQASPCGACRQFLAEFEPDLEILLVDPDRPDSIEIVTLGELLPRQFRL